MNDGKSKTATLTREELYTLVWTTPMSRLAPQFGLSDQGLAKICARFDIPRPQQGHWNKLAAGKPVIVKALPPARPGLSDTIKIEPTPSVGANPPTTEVELAAARAKVPAVRVMERLVRPHPIIAGWIADRDREIKKREEIYDHRVRRLVRAGPFGPMERRRHRVLDAIFKALEAEEISVAENERRELIASFGREKIEIQLRTKLQQVRRPLTKDEQRWRWAGDKDYKIDLVETEILIFEVKSWLPGGLKRNWQDGRKGTIETIAGDIVTTLLAAFPLMAADRARSEEQERLRQIEERRRRESEEQRKLARDQFRRFLEHAHKWRDVELARAFLEALTPTVSNSAETVGGKSATEWLAWAEASIAQNDVLRSDPLSVFESIAQVTPWTYNQR